MEYAILDGRQTSAFPLSIGTSLAFETLSERGGSAYDPEREIPEHIDLRKYDELWVNVYTLFRNCLGAIASVDKPHVTKDEAVRTLLSEMVFIEELVKGETQGMCKVEFYIGNYLGLTSRNSKAEVRIFKSAAQKQMFELYEKVAQEVANQRHNEKQPIHIFNRGIRPKNRSKALILTHMPYDLLAYTKFSTLDLIESHTGVLKKRNLWYTKLYPAGDMTKVPFTETTLKIFGDSQTFKPMPMKIRTMVLELANKRNWTWITGDEKVKADLKSIKDTFAGEMLANL